MSSNEKILSVLTSHYSLYFQFRIALNVEKLNKLYEWWSHIYNFDLYRNAPFTCKTVKLWYAVIHHQIINNYFECGLKRLKENYLGLLLLLQIISFMIHDTHITSEIISLIDINNKNN